MSKDGVKIKTCWPERQRLDGDLVDWGHRCHLNPKSSHPPSLHGGGGGGGVTTASKLFT